MPPLPPESVVEAPAEQPVYRWYHKATAVAAAVFCFELGVFLVIFPWVDDWEIQAAMLPQWGRPIWLDPWFRGAISGLGMLNVYISFTEVFRLKRFSSPAPPPPPPA